MSDTSPRELTVFTKLWQGRSTREVAENFAAWGIDGVEVPVRVGADVEPANARTDLPAYVATFSSFGLRVASIAAHPTRELIEACANAGVPAIRTLAPIDDAGYLDSVARIRDELSQLADDCAQAGVRIMIQQHTGRFVGSASGVAALLDGLPVEWFQAAWDAGHSALAAEAPDLSLEQVADRLGQVSLKSARYSEAMNTPGWTPQWVRAADGLNDWPAVARAIRRVDYRGVHCISAEYSNDIDIDAALREDARFIRDLLEATS